MSIIQLASIGSLLLPSPPSGALPAPTPSRPSPAVSVTASAQGDMVLPYGTGRQFNATEMAHVRAAMDDVSVVPGIGDAFDQWLDDGGQVGELTGGFYHAAGGKGTASTTGILIRLDDNPTPVQIRLRLYHEFGHVLEGANLMDPCQHGTHFAHTYFLAYYWCVELEDATVKCSTLKGLRRIVERNKAACEDSGGSLGAALPPSDPSCCKD